MFRRKLNWQRHSKTLKGNNQDWHNVKFDAGFQAAYWLWLTIFDTMIASKIIHNGRGSNYGHAGRVVQRNSTNHACQRIQESFKGGPIPGSSSAWLMTY